MDFTTKAIRESIRHKTGDIVFIHQRRKLAKLRPFFMPPQHHRRYADLTKYEQSMLAKKSKKILMDGGNSFFSFFCFNTPADIPKSVSNTSLLLIEYLISHGTTTRDIFRKEGIRSTYELLAKKIENNERINFSSYAILDLASALKLYIRDILNGLFDYSMIKKILKMAATKDDSSLSTYCHHLWFSLNDSQRVCLMRLRALFVVIAANSAQNKITWESLCNILSLTLTPQEAFKTVADVVSSVKFFKCLINIDIKTVYVDKFIST